MIRLVRLALPAVVAAAWAAPALGQRPVYIAPDVRGFQAQQMRQQAAQRAAVPAAPAATYFRPAPSVGGIPVVPESPEVRIAISAPAGVNPPATLAIRGPDGVLRTFPVEGGRNALQNQVIVVRPGQTVTLQLLPVPAAPGK